MIVSFILACSEACAHSSNCVRHGLTKECGVHARASALTREFSVKLAWPQSLVPERWLAVRLHLQLSDLHERARSGWLIHAFCIAVATDALDARDGRLEPAGAHVGVHGIKRTAMVGARTHGSFCLIHHFCFCKRKYFLEHALMACCVHCHKRIRALRLRIVQQGIFPLSALCAPRL